MLFIFWLKASFSAAAVCSSTREQNPMCPLFEKLKSFQFVVLERRQPVCVLRIENTNNFSKQRVEESKKKKFCIRQRKFENNTDVYLMNFLQYFAKFSFLDHIGFSFLALKLSKKSKAYPNHDANRLYVYQSSDINTAA